MKHNGILAITLLLLSTTVCAGQKEAYSTLQTIARLSQSGYQCQSMASSSFNSFYSQYQDALNYQRIEGMNYAAEAIYGNIERNGSMVIKQLKSMGCK